MSNRVSSTAPLGVIAVALTKTWPRLSIAIGTRWTKFPAVITGSVSRSVIVPVLRL